MLGSPLFLYLIKRGYYGLHQYVPLIAFICAALSASFKVYHFTDTQQGTNFLFIFGNAVWVTAYGLVWKGFQLQLQYIKTHFLHA